MITSSKVIWWDFVQVWIIIFSSDWIESITSLQQVTLWVLKCLLKSPQIACLRGCIIALVAFVWLFSTVCFQMFPQRTWIRACKVTLVTFVWLLSTVLFQMWPQIACMNGCKVTLVAFVWLFSTVHFRLKELGSEHVKSHWLHLFDFSPLCIF